MRSEPGQAHALQRRAGGVAVAAAGGQPPAPGQRAHDRHVQRADGEVQPGVGGLGHVGGPALDVEAARRRRELAQRARGTAWSCRRRWGRARTPSCRPRTANETPVSTGVAAVAGGQPRDLQRGAHAGTSRGGPRGAQRQGAGHERRRRAAPEHGDRGPGRHVQPQRAVQPEQALARRPRRPTPPPAPVTERVTSRAIAAGTTNSEVTSSAPDRRERGHGARADDRSRARSARRPGTPRPARRRGRRPRRPRPGPSTQRGRHRQDRGDRGHDHVGVAERDGAAEQQPVDAGARTRTRRWPGSCPRPGPAPASGRWPPPPGSRPGAAGALDAAGVGQRHAQRRQARARSAAASATTRPGNVAVPTACV